MSGFMERPNMTANGLEPWDGEMRLLSASWVPMRRLAQEGESPSSVLRMICKVLPIARSAKPLARGL